MTPVKYEDLKDLFLAARDLPGEERAAFLDERCMHDVELRRAVERMLDAHGRSEGPLPQSPADVATGSIPTEPAGRGGAESGCRGAIEPPDEPASAMPEASFPGYRVLRELNRGGQGVVYQAIQETTKRKVAIKVLLEGGYASASARKRFEREIELVAQLKHPNIISVLHSGTTGDGRQFCVMDYVRGTPLREYVREKKLSLEEALKLFATVAEAVQHAHQRGIIHRDLKPSNILVDADGSPKVLDFGLAKWVAAPVDSLVSITNQVVGTLPYLSPEQARGNPDEIDTRTDVYALGVILYELLTGHYPYPVVGQMADVLRHIAETEPTPPSRKWSGEPGVTRRSTKRLKPGQCPIDDEVQTIILCALAKERARRYQSAGELAKDVARYLAGAPIDARRDSGWYVLKKTLRRYRTAASVAAVFVLVVIAGFITSVTLWRRADKQRCQAEFQAYVANIGTVDRALAENDTVDALLRLNRCAPELRNWEWRHLMSRTDLSLATLRGDTRGVLSVTISLDGTRLASVAISPDGTRLASTQGNAVHLWDTSTGANVLTLYGHTDEVRSVAVSPDGQRVASASWDGTVKLWDVVSGTEVRTLSERQLDVLGHWLGGPTSRADAPTPRRHADAVRSVTFSPDGQRLAAASSFDEKRLWDVNSTADVPTLRGHTGFVNSVAFSPDGHRLASASADKMVKLWDVNSSAENLTRGDWIRKQRPASNAQILTLCGHTSEVLSVTFSPDGKRLASASRDNTVRVWSAVTGAEVLTLRGHRGCVYSVAFGPDGRRLASAAEDCTVKLWDASSGAEISTLCGHTRPVYSVAFSPDAQCVASVSADNTVKLWDATGDDQVRAVRGHTGFVNSVAFSPDGQRLASVSPDSTVNLLDAKSGAKLLTVRHTTSENPEWDHSCVRIAFSPDGQHLASASTDGTVKLWDAASGAELFTVRMHKGYLPTVAFSPDGRRLASASNKTIKLWDATSGGEILFLFKHTGYVRSVAFSPNGQRLASASWDRTVRVWNTNTGAEILTLAHTHSVNSVAFSPDGQRLASASSDETARLWDATSGREVMALRGHTDDVNSIAFSPNGQRLASASSDKTVKLWDAATGAEVLTLRGHTDDVASVAFSPDGQRLASASNDGTVRLWETVLRGDLFREIEALIEGFQETTTSPNALEAPATKPARD